MALSGHGNFGSYLHTIGKRETPACPDCGADEDTSDHAIFVCPAVADMRQSLQQALKNLDSSLAQIEWSATTFAVVMFRYASRSKIVLQHLHDIMQRSFTAERGIVASIQRNLNQRNTDSDGAVEPRNQRQQVFMDKWSHGLVAAIVMNLPPLSP
ncbi:hypothetical protein PGB90_000279 [Kerria lacca]